MGGRAIAAARGRAREPAPGDRGIDSAWTRLGPRLGLALALLVTGAAYFVAAWAGLRMAVFPETASPVWPATGVAIASVALLGLRVGPAIAVGAFLVEWPAFGPAGALLAATGNTAEALLGGWLLRRLGGASALRTSSGVGRFLGIAAVAPVPSALLGTLAVARLGGPTPLAEVAMTWYLGNVMGALVVAPAIVLAAHRSHSARRVPGEWTAFAAATLVLAFIGFYPWRAEGWADIRLGFLAIAPIAWAATRFGPLVTAWTAIGIAAAAMAGLRAGTVPLMGSENDVLLQLQALTGVVTILGLLLAASVHQRDAVIRRLRDNDAQLRQALAALDRADRMKTMFLNKAAHELRTPLTPLRLQLDLLRLGAAPDQQHAVTVAQRSADRLSALVESLVQAARLEPGELPGATRVDLAPVVEAAVHPLRQAAASKDVEIVQDVGPVAIHGDATATRRALGHLLSNALRHAPRGSHVLVGALRRGDWVDTTVVDHGPGIPLGDRERLFEPFAEPTRIAADQGVGLGLYVARSLALAQGGDLTATDTPGGGMTFTLRLPAAPADPGGAAAAAAHVHRTTTARGGAHDGGPA